VAVVAKRKNEQQLDPDRLKSLLNTLEAELEMMEKSWKPSKKLEDRKYNFMYVKVLTEAFFIKGKLSVLESEIKFDKDLKFDYIG
jgi:hypothetical protein